MAKSFKSKEYRIHSTGPSHSGSEDGKTLGSYGAVFHEKIYKTWEPQNLGEKRGALKTHISDS